MDDFIMKPKIDFAFKELMTNEMVRKGFLAAFLKLNPADIKDTRILNTDLRREHEDDKQGILDVRVSLNNDIEKLIYGQTARFFIYQKCMRNKSDLVKAIEC